MITLFSVQRDEKRRISSIVFSAIAHVVTIALVSIGVYQSKIGAPIPVTHFQVRQLDLETPREAMKAPDNAIEYQAPKQTAKTPSAGGSPKVETPALREVAKAERGPQTLVQPDIHTHVALKKPIPVPTLAIWQPVKVAVEKIVAPLPQQVVAMQVTPSLESPNEALLVRDVEISPSDLSNEKLPIVASTTTPLALTGQDLPQPAPVTASRSSSQPTPATVVSLSNLAMLNGTVVLPPINETASKASAGAMGSGQGKNNARPGNGNGTGGGQGSGAGPTAGEGKETGGGNGSRPGSGQGPGGASGTGSLTVAHITLPKNGRFGAVVVGDSLEAEFPEVAGVWSGRLAYTVYLHVGLSKSWILQYALPRASDARSAGVVAQLMAPWPYSIVRPNLVAGSIDSDALLVHGYVNRLGRFESLSIAFPANFPEGRFVLSSLQQWEFRPATEDGQAARVEVLLIIPEDGYDSGSVTPAQGPSSGFVHSAELPAMSVYSSSGH
jgi:hypothetical protein